MSALSAISWQSAGATHEAAFTIGADNAAYMSKDAAAFVSLGGYVTAVTAGLDSSGNPELFGIGSNDAAFVNHLNGGGWTSLGGVVKAISAAGNDTLYGIGSDDSVWVDNLGSGKGWVGLGGNAKAISVGSIGSGGTVVYAIGSNNAVSRNDGSGWTNLGGHFTQISATGNNTVYAIGTNGAVSVSQGSGWTNLGGYARAISAVCYSNGDTAVYAIGSDNATYVRHASGWTGLGGYATELSVPADNSVYARGGIANSIYAARDGAGFAYVGATPLANPQADVSYSTAPAGAPLFHNGQPSYLDVMQGAVGDCWLMASLAEVADRAPQDLTGMFTYQGTTVDNGATVPLYTVRLYSSNGIAFQVPVDTELPVGGAYYNHPQNALGTTALWAALAEKAYAEANGLGLVNTSNEGRDSYDAMNNGYPSWALQAITGKAATDAPTNTTSLVSDWNAGCLIVLGTGAPASSYIVGGHDYAVVGYNPSSSTPFEIFNPWGTDSAGWAPGNVGKIYGRVWENATFISQNFDWQFIGTGAMNTNTIAGKLDELTELAALGDVNGLSKMIRPARHGGTDVAVDLTGSIDHFPGSRPKP